MEKAKNNNEIEITREMVLAGVERMRKSLSEFSLGSADFLVVLEILETALSVQRCGRRSFLTKSSKQKILAGLV